MGILEALDREIRDAQNRIDYVTDQINKYENIIISIEQNRPDKNNFDYWVMVLNDYYDCLEAAPDSAAGKMYLTFNEAETAERQKWMEIKNQMEIAIDNINRQFEVVCSLREDCFSERDNQFRRLNGCRDQYNREKQRLEEEAREAASQHG